MHDKLEELLDDCDQADAGAEYQEAQDALLKWIFSNREELLESLHRLEDLYA